MVSRAATTPALKTTIFEEAPSSQTLVETYVLPIISAVFVSVIAKEAGIAETAYPV